MAAIAFGSWLPRLVAESYRMSSLSREPTSIDISAHRGLVAANNLRLENVEIFMSYIAPSATLKRVSDLDQSHDDAVSGAVKDALASLLALACTHSARPKEVMRLFHLLQPFTKANGRLTRAVWMWQMSREPGADARTLGELSFPDSDGESCHRTPPPSRPVPVSRSR